jgi:hypothetical protein
MIESRPDNLDLQRAGAHQEARHAGRRQRQQLQSAIQSEIQETLSEHRAGNYNWFDGDWFQSRTTIGLMAGDSHDTREQDSSLQAVTTPDTNQDGAPLHNSNSSNYAAALLSAHSPSANVSSFEGPEALFNANTDQLWESQWRTAMQNEMDKCRMKCHTARSFSTQQHTFVLHF